MAQQDHFSTVDLAPEAWVRAVEAFSLSNRQWRDGSWGNNAAPSWELWQGEKASAEAFYYTVSNVERVTNLFGSEPFVTVCLLDQEGNVRCSFDVSAETFLRIAAAAVGKTGDLASDLEASAKDLGDRDRVCWHES